MGTLNSFRKAYGALKDSTKVGLANLNSEFKVIINFIYFILLIRNEILYYLFIY